MKRFAIIVTLSLLPLLTFAAPARAQYGWGSYWPADYSPVPYATSAISSGSYWLSWPNYNWPDLDPLPPAILGPGPFGGYGYLNQYGNYEFNYPKRDPHVMTY